MRQIKYLLLFNCDIVFEAIKKACLDGCVFNMTVNIFIYVKLSSLNIKHKE